MNHRLGIKSSFEDPFNSRAIPYMETNLIDQDDLADSKATFIDPKEVQSKIGFLKKWVAEEEAKCTCLEKQREQATMNAIIERDNLLRRMASLKEQNKKLEERTLVLHADVFGDVHSLRTKVQEQEKLLRKRQEPVIAQVQPYKPIQKDPVEPSIKHIDKGKGKAIGIQINEPQAVASKFVNPPMSKLDSVYQI